ncbi:MAG: hypothetical protein V7K97_18255 [Nostoc sp.]|uniref:hypothetical protein n=1 Tax=Nostoc sp. TaxID=1180 RepID=UPI002FF9376F
MQLILAVILVNLTIKLIKQPLASPIRKHCTTKQRILNQVAGYKSLGASHLPSGAIAHEKLGIGNFFPIPHSPFPMPKNSIPQVAWSFLLLCRINC